MTSTDIIVLICGVLLFVASILTVIFSAAISRGLLAINRDFMGITDAVNVNRKAMKSRSKIRLSTSEDTKPPSKFHSTSSRLSECYVSTADSMARGSSGQGGIIFFGVAGVVGSIVMILEAVGVVNLA